jgi:DNA (cytosine-5)-methyltransferase 1
MIHLGDITKISGYTAPIVDVVVGGSPCQDLSVAGKRAGLDGERSGLFIEQLRVIKEMRENDRRNGRTNELIRPRYMVWENVPGAFSSNKAEDFRIVLEETAKLCDQDASIPMPDNGKWTTAGCILGNGWSIAWRVCDAQFYGVPQRRRRIALIADFGGLSAPEILFIRKSVSRDTESSQPQRKETPTDASRGTGADDIFCIDGDKLNKQERKGGSDIGYRDGDKQYTLTAKDVHGVAYCFEPGAAKRLGGYVWEDLAPTLRTEVGDNRPSVLIHCISLISLIVPEVLLTLCRIEKVKQAVARVL